MEQEKRKKRPALSAHTRKEIGIFRSKNPNVSYEKIAEKFDCTPEQAKQACYAFKNGKLKTKRSNGTTAAKAKLIKTTDQPEQILADQFHYALCQLQADEKLDVEARVPLIERLSRINRHIIAAEIQNHLNRPDGSFLIHLGKKFMPEASPKEILLTIRQELEVWKISAE